jgi:hypothetical protein
MGFLKTLRKTKIMMFANLVSNMTAPAGAEAPATKRKHERRETDRCVSVVGGRTYPVINWSAGGLLISADPKSFGIGDEINVTMKFKMRNEIITVPHKATVVRKSFDKVAFQFLPLTRQIRNAFQTVVDDYIASRFAESQLPS